MEKSYRGYKNRGFFLACLVTLVSFFGVIAASGTSLATTPQISAGKEGHALGLKSDGTVWAWGQNFEGQLGDGTTAHRNTPVQASGMSDAIAVAAGANHSLALKSDGTVWAWGKNSYGQLSGLSGITAIAAGANHSLALKSDGTVWAWGNNYYGQLGDGTTTGWNDYRNTPLQLSSLSSVTAIACGNDYSLAVKSDGTVWAWGYNGKGQLGDGTYTDRNTPVQVSGLSDVVAIAGGGTHSLALKADGTVWACGWNALGQLGDGTGSDRNSPVQVNGLSGAIAVSAGQSHSLALKSDGTVWVWGRNDNGELGNGANTSKDTPVQVNSLSGIVAISGGGILGSGYSLALKSDGTVWAWGRGDYGQLGDGTNTDRNTPVQVSGLNLGSTTITTPTPTPSPASSPTATPSPTATSTPTPTPSPTSSPSGTGIVFGYVYDEDDNLEGVTVTIAGNGYSDSVNTDEDGYYEFDEVPAGNYTVTYTKTGYETQTQEVTVEEGDTVELDTVTMPAVQKGSIYGYVTDIRGNPIESVRLKLSGIRTKIKKSTSTDSDGFFEFTDLDAGTYRIVAKKKFYKAAQKTVVVEEGEDVEIEIEMKKTRSRKILPGEEEPDVIESASH